MSRDFIFRVKEGQPLPATDPDGYRVILDETTGLFKLLTSEGDVISSPAESRLAELEATITALPATPTTTIVNITSAQILAMGTTPIELLPALPTGSYYEIDKMYFETTRISSSYSFTDAFLITGGVPNRLINKSIITVGSGTRATIVKDFYLGYDGSLVNVVNQIINTPSAAVTLRSNTATSPTGGDGTLRVVIIYTVITFGA